jgi:hypothetical protein
LQQGTSSQVHLDPLSLERAGKERDQRSAALAVLVVDGVRNEFQGSGMLYQNMLKARSRADER